VAQFLYFSYSGGFLQASALRYATQVGSVTGTIKLLVTPHLIFFLLGVPLVALSYVWTRANGRSLPSSVPLKLKIVLAIVLIATPTASYGYVALREKQETGDTKGLYSRLFNTREVVGKLGPVSYSLEDLIRWTLSSKTVRPEDIALVKAWGQQHAKVTSGKLFGSVKGRNLIMIQVESLENFPINR